eukprot:SAG11_NODE_295_length_11115_cov_14.005264_5_plen_61_part_00
MHIAYRIYNKGASSLFINPRALLPAALASYRGHTMCAAIAKRYVAHLRSLAAIPAWPSVC